MHSLSVFFNPIIMSGLTNLAT